MKFLSITGPKADIDRVVNQYLSKYEIHLENALSELKTVEELRPFMEINPYKELLNKANEFVSQLSQPVSEETGSMDVDTAVKTIQELSGYAANFQEKRTELSKKHEELLSSLQWIEPFLNFDFNIHEVFGFKFVKYRFGKIAHEYYEKFEKYVYDNLDTVFFKCASDEQYVWGVYFVPATQAVKVDAVYSSLHFERMRIPDEYEGTPEEAVSKLKKDLASIDEQLKNCQAEVGKKLESRRSDLLKARNTLDSLSTNFDVRKLAACTKAKNDKQVFYILCGWMTERDAERFQKDIEDDVNLYCILEDDENNILNQPPTKLKNPKLFKPFEMYVKMYGLPAYGEMDPTWFVAITYSFIFGAMFGDAGQGLLLFIGGLLLYKLKHIDLAGIISCAGVFSTFFGLMFGSIFGFEDVIPALWLRPVDSMTTIPFIGKLNTVFIVAIGFGMGIILLCMVFNIINSFKTHDVEKTWFDTNAVAGLVFYGSAVLCIGLFVSGHAVPGGAVLAIMFGLPLLLIFFKEPLTNLVEKKAEVMPKEKGMFIVQGIFELFEVILSYFSNTLSFVRIGAFAVSHAAMMEVVLMLAGAENGSPNWIVIILGNLFVCAMEGLIVGIQVLRLEYYEMFSRFYKGSGRKFEPFCSKNK